MITTAQYHIIVTILFVLALLLQAVLYRTYRLRRMKETQAALRLAEERAKELRVLKELAETLNQTLPPELALEAGLEQVARYLGASAGWFLTVTPDQKAELSAGFNLPPNMELARGSNRSWALCACLKDMLSQSMQSPTHFDCERLARTPGLAEDMKQHLSIPVRASGVPVGIINLIFPPKMTFNQGEMRLISALGDQFGGASERARLFREVHHLAVTDPLTGLYNRRFFLETALKEMERSRRYQRPISIAMLDIDFFKLINDTYGHLAGDLALIEVARICQEAIRKIDLVGRFGGEEIVILLPETSPEQALNAIERLRQQVEKLEVVTPRGTVRITTSAGVASLGATEDLAFFEFLDRADQALYRAKSEGRNRVCVI